MKKKQEYPLPLKERISIIIVAILFIGVFVYLALKIDRINPNDLKTFEITLVSEPQYSYNKIKSRRYQSIVFKAYEFEKEFSISGPEYYASDHKSILTEIKAGDKVTLKLRNTSTIKLKEVTFWSKRNRAFGVSKNGKEYVDLRKIVDTSEKDSKWAYIFVVWGLVILPYGFIKSKPLINLDKAIFIFSVISLILIILFG